MGSKAQAGCVRYAHQVELCVAQFNQGGTAETAPFVPVGNSRHVMEAFLFGKREEQTMLTQRPRGTSDILPAETVKWQAVEDSMRQSFRRYHYGEIRTPIFEHTELFARGVGETTDIVSKEMYTFADRAERSLTLRPEGTAGVVRAYVENKLYGEPGLTKLYYIGPMFRYEKPQKGRERQFYQYGCEVLGSDAPAADAEVVALNLNILTDLGLTDLHLKLNSVGCTICRPNHRERMIAALTPYQDELCTDCQHRLTRNPLRIFDCKNRSCQAVLVKSGAPTILEALCEECSTHFTAVRQTLEAMDVTYELNDRLVRGLDYYTRTAWEITVPTHGTVAGGGRYNGLVATVGGPETPGIGFAGGMERALLVLEQQGGSAGGRGGLDVFVSVAHETAESAAMRLLQELRGSGLSADRDYLGRSLKAQFREADRQAAKFVAILGDEEVANQSVSLKNLATGEQQTVPLTEAVLYLVKKVGEAS